MKVYVCSYGYYDGGHCWSSTAKVVLTEEKAIEWVIQEEHTESEWREYEEYEVE